MSREDGGPAFPCEFVQHQRGEVGNNTPIMARSSGMTLRDYFAAKAMQALLTVDGTTHFPQRAMEAYQMADAMLAARKEETR